MVQGVLNRQRISVGIVSHGGNPTHWVGRGQQFRELIVSKAAGPIKIGNAQRIATRIKGRSSKFAQGVGSNERITGIIVAPFLHL